MATRFWYTGHFDAASQQPPPGHSGIGFIIRDPYGGLVREYSQYIGRATVNVAEYTALVALLQAVQEDDITHIDIRGDSQLVIRQLLGQYEVHNSKLQPLYQQAAKLLLEIPNWTLVHISRKENKEADRLSRRELNKYLATVEGQDG